MYRFLPTATRLLIEKKRLLNTGPISIQSCESFNLICINDGQRLRR
jgi:hypothetical protein